MPTPPFIAALDTNNDGVIDAGEISKASENLKKLDKNGDGKLSPDEYRASIAKKEDAEQRFKIFDTNHDGALSEEEFVKAGKP